MTKILLIVLLFVLVILILFLFIGIFVGMGYVISLLLPLSLFEASILSISTTLVVGFILLGISINTYLNGDSETSFIDDENDFKIDEEWEEEEEEIRDPIIIKPPKLTPSGRVGRNAPCPCGSEKKYKNCCGKYSA